MTKKTVAPEQTDAPSLLLDTYGNPSLVSAGALIESAWGNSLVNRSILKFPNRTAMVAVTPPAGTIAWTADNGAYWVHIDGWKATAIGPRLGFRGVAKAGGQGISSNTLTQALWTMTDPNGITNGTSTLTVPAGWGGRWMFEWQVEFPPGGPGSVQVFFNSTVGRVGEMAFNAADSESQTRVSGAGSVVLNAAQGGDLVMYHTMGGVEICNVTGYFQGYYIGPY